VCTAGADINQLEDKDLCISDHNLLSFNLSVPLQKLQKRVISFRNLKNIDLNQFSCMINESLAGNTVNHYNLTLI